MRRYLIVSLLLITFPLTACNYTAIQPQQKTVVKSITNDGKGNQNKNQIIADTNSNTTTNICTDSTVKYKTLKTRLQCTDEFLEHRLLNNEINDEFFELSIAKEFMLMTPKFTIIYSGEDIDEIILEAIRKSKIKPFVNTYSVTKDINEQTGEISHLIEVDYNSTLTEIESLENIVLSSFITDNIYDKSRRERIEEIHPKITLLTKIIKYEPNNSSPYYLYTNKAGNSKTIANTYSMILDVLNIENGIVKGTKQQDVHYWNAVKLDGVTYYIDLTEQQDNVFLTNEVISNREIVNIIW